MASKELIEKVARAIKNADREICSGLDDLYEEQARAAISTILAALQEPTEEMINKSRGYYVGSTPYAVLHYKAMLNASPLGEQSE